MSDLHFFSPWRWAQVFAARGVGPVRCALRSVIWASLCVVFASGPWPLPPVAGTSVSAMGDAWLSALVRPVWAQTESAPELEARAEHLRQAYLDARQSGGDLASLRDSLAYVAGRLTNLSPPRDSLAALIWHDAGWASFYSGDQGTARTYWDNGLERARVFGDRSVEGTLLNAVAVGYATAGNLELGIETWSDLIEIRRGLRDSVGESKVWGNLANAYAILGRYPEATFATEQAASLNAATGNHEGTVAGLHRQAGMLQVAGDLEMASTLADSAVALARVYELDYILPDVLPRRATIRFDLGEREAARHDLEEVMKLAEQMGNRDAHLLAKGNLGIVLTLTGNPEGGLALLDQAAEEAGEAQSGHIALQTAAARGRALMDLGRLSEAEAVLRSAVETYEGLREETEDPFSKAGLFVRVGSIYATLAECIRRQGDVEEAWQTVERGSAAVFRQAVAPDAAEPIPLQELQDRLTAVRAVLLQFPESWGRELPIYLVTPDSVEAIVVPEGSGAVQDARTALRLMSAGAELGLCRTIAGRVSTVLLTEILARIPAAAERIYVVSSSELAGFPFESLPLPGDPVAVLGDRFPVSYLPGASSLRSLQDRRVPEASIPLLAFADPTPSLQEEDPLVPDPLRDVAGIPLPFARTEVERIAPRNARIHVGPEALPATFVAGIREGAAVLHIATHGVLDPSNPARSSLVFAGERPLVSASEIESLSVEAELVTLSGCRTLGGYSVLGEGVFGLSRSFLLAGARSVVSSLWDVEDEAACRFMELFYASLRKGNPRDVSLRNAQREMAREGHRHRDWAGFVLTGIGHEPVRALAGSDLGGAEAPGYERWLVGVAIVLVIAFGIWRARRSRKNGTSFKQFRIWFVLVAPPALLGTGALLFGCSEEEEEPVPDYVVDGSAYGLRTIDLRDIIPGNVSPSAFPALNDPLFLEASMADWLADDDLVVGVEIGGDARAYPLRILWYHYAVNDLIAGQPLIVTHSLPSGSSVVFDGRFDGGRRFFEVTGRFYNSNAIFRDVSISAKPERWVPQMYGVIVQGPGRGELWPQLPFIETTWAEWRRLHPKTRVLSKETGHVRDYDTYPLGEYPEDDDWIMFALPDYPGKDAGWKDLAFGVGLGGSFKLYLLETVAADRLILDLVGGEPMSVFVDAESRTAWALRRSVGGRTLQLSLDPGLDGMGASGSASARALGTAGALGTESWSAGDDERFLRDPESGARWRVDGRLIDAGSLEGAADLASVVNAYRGYWFAWSVYHLGADVWRE